MPAVARSPRFLVALLAFVYAGCATTGTPTPRPFPGATARHGPDAPGAPRPAIAPDAPLGPVSGRAIAEFALGFRGVPYRLGGADPAGFDCSGLVQYVFAQYGIPIPRVVEQQFEVGSKIKPKNLRPGDLIFFDTSGHRGAPASHVAIALGGDSFVHAPNSSGVVRVETLASSYWGARYVGARRIAGSTATN